MINLLLPTEKIVVRSDSERVIVTDRRVLLLDQNNGISKSSDLVDIEYILVERVKNPILGVLSAAALLGSVYLFFAYNLFALVVGLAVAVVLYGLYSRIVTEVLCICINKAERSGYRIKKYKGNANAIKNDIEAARFELLNSSVSKKNISTKTVPIRTVI